MSFLLLMISELYAYASYGIWPGGGELLCIYAILMVNAFADAAMVLLLVSFLKTGNALAACCTILGALIGFLTGIYLPIGSLPEKVQWMVKAFPVSHGVSLLRQVLMKDMIGENFGGSASAQSENFMEYMGVRYTADGSFLSERASIAYLMASAILCIILAGLRFSRKNRR